MKRISVFVSDPQYDQFKALAQAWDQPASELIRMALNEFLGKHRLAEPRQKRTERKRAVTRKRS